ncbi:DUF6113 family protein [Nocardioides panacisoli]|uniref:DUF6113 family protein n=1 Tax=Nocardioides panacisoli TaxID=627624 RepID=UPI003CC7CC57
MGDRPVRGTLSSRSRSSALEAATARAGVVVALLVGGATVAVCVIAVHPRWWGLVLGLAATAAALWALPDRWWARTPFALGWAVTVLVATGGRREGDFVIASDPGGYTVLATVILVTLTGALALRPRRPGAGEDSGSAGPAS